jgi:hypothetical protein
MKIIEYKTAHGSSVQELDEDVNAMLRDGFQPFGSPYLSDQEVEGRVGTFAVWQAMVRYEGDIQP